MKLRQSPDDFHVEELTDVHTSHGAFAFYRLEKSGWTTPDAIAAIRRRWQIDLPRVSYGGLKDRHAQTTQYFTIQRGPKRNLKHHAIQVTYLGQVARPYLSQHIRANRFQLVLRAMSPRAIDQALQALEEVRREGVPNYFDDQRFGSVGEGQEFVAKLLILGRYEEALAQALAAPYEFDRAEQKQEKAILRQHWGDWPACKTHLPRGHARSLVDYLVSHPQDYRGALARLRPDLRGLYLSAYQSYLWNRILAAWLGRHCPADRLLTFVLKMGPVPMHRGLDPATLQALRILQLPLPSARLKIDPEGPMAHLIQGVLAEEGLELGQLKLRGFREMFFSKGERAALCQPDDLMGEASADERHPGQCKLTMRFDLPRGAYATLLVKRAAQASAGSGPS